MRLIESEAYRLIARASQSLEEGNQQRFERYVQTAVQASDTYNAHLGQVYAQAARVRRSAGFDAWSEDAMSAYAPDMVSLATIAQQEATTLRRIDLGGVRRWSMCGPRIRRSMHCMM